MNRQQIDHEKSIIGYTFSKPVTGWKPVYQLTDGQTDRGTHDNSIHRTSIVSRGKNELE